MAAKVMWLISIRRNATNESTRRLTDNARVSYFIPKAGTKVQIKHNVEQNPANSAFGSIPAMEYTR